MCKKCWKYWNTVLTNQKPGLILLKTWTMFPKISQHFDPPACLYRRKLILPVYFRLQVPRFFGIISYIQIWTEPSDETCYIRFQSSRLICSYIKQWDHLQKPSFILSITHYLSDICKSHFGLKGARLLSGEAFPQRVESSGETLWLYPYQWLWDYIDV